MTRQKLSRYAYIQQDSYIINGLQEQHILFPEAGHIVLEIACGRGEYSIGLAPYAPDTLHIGVDQKWERIAVGMKRARSLWLENVRFVCGIVHHLDRWFAPQSVDEIWIIHPDPRPRDRDEKRRLTHPRFLTIFQNLLKTGWYVHLKTDDHTLFAYSCEQFSLHGWECVRMTTDLYAAP